MTNKLVRLTNTCLVQFNGIITKPLFDNDIYALRFDKKIQLITGDGTYNSVDNSYSPYVDNILLKKTPYPWFSDEFLKSNALSLQVTPNVPNIEYQQISINFIAGYNYGIDDYLSMTRFYYIIDDMYELTVSAVVDYKANSRFKPNTVNVVLDSAIFNTSLDTEIINIQQLFQSTNEEIIKIKEYLFPNMKSCSELFIEHAIIEKSQILDFEQQGKSFQKFFIENLAKSYYNRSLDLGEELFVKMTPVINKFDKYISIRLEHTKFNIEAYLKKYLYETDTWDIKYEITQTAYDNNDNIISSISQYSGNFNTPYSEILYKPFITNDWFNELDVLKVHYCVLDVRCIAKTSVSNLEINRWGQIILNDLMTYFMKTNIISKPATQILYSKKEIVNHQVTMKSDLPDIIEIIKPLFIFTQTSENIKLIPFNFSLGIQFQLTSNIVNATKIKIRFDAREYECKKYESGKLVFNIPGSEYMNSTKTYYLTYDDSVLSYGNIERIK